MARNLVRSQPTSSSEGVLTPKRSHRAWFSTTAVPTWFCTSTPPGKCRITSIKCAWAVAKASSVSRRSVVSTRVQITSPSGCCGSRGVPLIENQRSAPVAVRMRYSTSTPPCSRTTSTYCRKCVKAASCRCRTLVLLPCSGRPSSEKVSTALWLASAMMRSGVEMRRAAAALSSSCLPKVCFLLAGGDVGLGADDQPGNFCVVRRNLPSDFHPPPCALLGEQACFHVEGLAQGDLALQRGEHPVAIIRVHMLLPHLKVQLLRKHFVAQHLVAALVHLDDAGAGVPFPQAVLHGRHGQAQPRFAAAQCFHHGVLFSHVVDVPVPQRGPISFALRLGLAGQPPDLAVGQHLAPFVAPQFQRAG